MALCPGVRRRTSRDGVQVVSTVKFDFSWYLKDSLLAFLHARSTRAVKSVTVVTPSILPHLVACSERLGGEMGLRGKAGASSLLG